MNPERIAEGLQNISLYTKVVGLYLLSPLILLAALAFGTYGAIYDWHRHRKAR